MKKIICAVLGLAVAFLAGVFYNVSFDISTWSAEGRATILILMGFAAFSAWAVVAIGEIQ